MKTPGGGKGLGDPRKGQGGERKEEGCVLGKKNDARGYYSQSITREGSKVYGTLGKGKVGQRMAMWVNRRVNRRYVGWPPAVQERVADRNHCSFRPASREGGCAIPAPARRPTGPKHP